ncbi:MAG: hypothetical protein SGI71_05810 [Verrucomicrobiota bacterium]|nr:hypothetical protein [Verrucomicrobiota bacterium]
MKITLTSTHWKGIIIGFFAVAWPVYFHTISNVGPDLHGKELLFPYLFASLIGGILCPLFGMAAHSYSQACESLKRKELPLSLFASMHLVFLGLFLGASFVANEEFLYFETFLTNVLIFLNFEALAFGAILHLAVNMAAPKTEDALNFKQTVSPRYQTTVSPVIKKEQRTARA